jgi:hypothetical protein
MKAAQKEQGEIHKARQEAWEASQNEEAEVEVEQDNEDPDKEDTAAEDNEGAEASVDVKPKDEKETLMTQLEREALDYLEEQIGRYVPGYRQYESYQNYAVKYPDRNMSDYINDMNREVTCDEYIDIARSAVRFYVRISPDLRMELNEMTEGHPEKFEWVINSEEMGEKFREKYAYNLKRFYQSKQVFKLVDALEEFMDCAYYGDVSKFPKYNIHIPSPYQMMGFQKFMSKHNGPKSFNTMKVGQGEFLNPFKATPVTNPVNIPDVPQFKMQFNKKLRRMGGNPLRQPKFFSTYLNINDGTIQNTHLSVKDLDSSIPISMLLFMNQ